MKGAEYTIKWSITQAENELAIDIEDWEFDETFTQLERPVITHIKFKKEGGSPEYHYEYEGLDITDKVNSGDYRWEAGNYVVYAVYEGNDNFKDVESARVKFVVERMRIAKPSLANSVFTYSGNETDITANGNINNFNENRMSITAASATKGTAAGKYSIVIQLGANYQWNDDTTADITLNWQINRKVVPAPELESGGTTVYDPDGNNKITILHYDGEYFSDVAGDRLTINGENVSVSEIDPSKAIAGTYYITVTLNSNYCVNSTDADNFGETLTVKLTWVIQRLGVERPTAVQQETYTGDVLEYRLANGFIAYSAKTGDGASINAGYYDVIFTLNPNYCWGASGSDATADHTLADGFTILRQEIDKPTIEASSLETVYNAEAQTVTAAGYDAVTMEYAATAQEKGDEISSEDGVTFTATNAGTYNITFRLTNTKNYTWKGGDTAPNGPAAGTVEFTWVINKADIKVTGEDEYNGWAYGVTPTDPDRLNIVPVLAADSSKQIGDLDITYTYKDSGGSVLKDGISATSPAGNYTLVVSVAEGENTRANTREYTFTITKNTAVISDATLDGKTENISWTYGDKPGELSYTVTVGDTDITGSANVEYFTPRLGGKRRLGKRRHKPFGRFRCGIL